MQADDEEKANLLKRQQERAQKRAKRGLSVGGKADDSSVESVEDSATQKMVRLDDSSQRLLPAIHYPVTVSSSSSSTAGGTGLSLSSDEMQLEREKMRLDMELKKEKMRLDREREREEYQAKRDESLMRQVQEQLTASRAMLQACQEMMGKVLEKVGTQ